MRIGAREITFERPALMGVLNVTPDSFSDGGAWVDPTRAIGHALKMAASGADIIDIGGESSRPNAVNVSPAEELRRVLPVIRGLRRRSDVPISIDTCKAAVAAAAIEAGADMVNDISGLRFDPLMPLVIADAGVPVVLMHIQGTPGTMQVSPQYHDVVQDVGDYLQESIDIAGRYGIQAGTLIIDPGIGFGKTLEHNITILKQIDVLMRRFSLPIMIGTSRKSMIGGILGVDDPLERVYGTLATSVFLTLKGVHILRVHDVAANLQAVKMAAALK